MITNYEINDDKNEEEDELPLDKDIKEEDNEPTIIHDEDDIIEDDISIESSDEHISISVK